MNEAEARLLFDQITETIAFPFEVELRFRRLTTSFGKAHKQGRYRRITLSRQFLEAENFEYDGGEFRDTVVHELCHLWGKRHFVRANSREFKKRFEASIRAIRAPIGSTDPFLI